MSKFLEQLESNAEQKGIGIGRIRTLCELVHDGTISIQDAARRAGISEEKFLEEMESAGFELHYSK